MWPKHTRTFLVQWLQRATILKVTTHAQVGLENELPQLKSCFPVMKIVSWVEKIKTTCTEGVKTYFSARGLGTEDGAGIGQSSRQSKKRCSGIKRLMTLKGDYRSHLVDMVL